MILKNRAGNLLMANAETLEKVYSAIASLRARGLPHLDVELVARTAGVARSTFYLKDEDWKEVRAVIGGKPSERIKLVQVEVERKSVATLQIEALSKRLAHAEEEVSRIQSTADKVYKQLIDEVQRWFVKASETPAKQAQMARYIQELNSTRREVESLRSENRVLQAQAENTGVIRPLVHKRKIALNTLQPPGEIFTSFLKQLDLLIPEQTKAHEIVAAYVLCGFPCSGKTQWAESHQPSTSGIHIYVDSYGHTADIRRFIADRIRNTTKAEVHCIWLRTNADAGGEQTAPVGTIGEKGLEGRLLQRVKSTFEIPAFDEPFDSIILPKGLSVEK